MKALWPLWAGVLVMGRVWAQESSPAGEGVPLREEAAAVAVVSPEAPREFAVYPIEAPDPEALLEAVKALASEGDKVVHDVKGHRFFVFATPEMHRQIAALLDLARLPAMNIRIAVDIGDIGSENRTSAGIGGSGTVVIGGGDVGGEVVLRPHLEKRTTGTDRSTVQTLLVQNGGEAILKVGESVPHLEWLLDYGRRRQLVTSTLVFQEVGAVLRVQARVIGEGPRMVLRIVPELSGFADGQRERITFTELATEITVSDGQSVALGGLEQNSEFYSRFLVGMERSGQTRRLTIRATPTIEKPQ